ncbi:MAG TPA: VanZ family protein [Flavilitoribacter sp.]|nr:VanZ family protein [Lewinella sp.]MCB9281353.1 VanZ family protein [Lewinellaceae bacterium]HMQ63034.1 VanZ family protein [Flavilitoribacter sp.]HMQ90248.1 VanZ family protein [Flavilitoribacter sp.]
MHKAFIPGITWGLAVLILSTMPGKNLPSFDLTGVDKLEHAVSYCLLASLFLWGLHRSGNWSVKGRNWIIAACISYGILIEIIQYCFFPSRYFEVNDIVANIIGSIGSLLFIRFFKK